MTRKAFAALGAVLAAGCSVIGAGDKAPEPPFETVARIDEATEIRRYGPRTAAAVPMAEGESAAFGLLFDYISGANDGGARIAMTAPVATRGRGAEIAMTAPVALSADEMLFFLPESLTADTAPKPRDPRVAIRTIPEQTIAVRRWSGLRGERALHREAGALLGALDASAWVPVGPAEGWFYDPPWTLPPFRRNEAAVPVAPR
jgi:hypothetical protein